MHVSNTASVLHFMRVRCCSQQYCHCVCVCVCSSVIAHSVVVRAYVCVCVCAPSLHHADVLYVLYCLYCLFRESTVYLWFLGTTWSDRVCVCVSVGVCLLLSVCV